MNPMMILQMMFGNKAQEMMNKWNSMSPEQKQAELSKVSGMSREQQMQYLQNMGLDTSVFNQMKQNTTMTPQNNQGGNTSRFNY
jgi:hypothetical protein